jgi:MtN3 and saliva related transmembrane protein
MNISEPIELLGYAAAVCTTGSFVPQVMKILRARDVSGISTAMYSIFCIGVLLWTSYGVCIRSLPVVVANAITLLLAGTVLVLKIRYDLFRKR